MLIRNREDSKAKVSLRSKPACSWFWACGYSGSGEIAWWYSLVSECWCHLRTISRGKSEIASGQQDLVTNTLTASLPLKTCCQRETIPGFLFFDFAYFRVRNVSFTEGISLSHVYKPLLILQLFWDQVKSLRVMKSWVDSFIEGGALGPEVVNTRKGYEHDVTLDTFLGFRGNDVLTIVVEHLALVPRWIWWELMVMNAYI